MEHDRDHQVGQETFECLFRVVGISQTHIMQYLPPLYRSEPVKSTLDRNVCHASQVLRRPSLVWHGFQIVRKRRNRHRVPSRQLRMQSQLLRVVIRERFAPDIYPNLPVSQVIGSAKHTRWIQQRDSDIAITVGQSPVRIRYSSTPLRRPVAKLALNPNNVTADPATNIHPTVRKSDLRVRFTGTRLPDNLREVSVKRFLFQHLKRPLV